MHQLLNQQITLMSLSVCRLIKKVWLVLCSPNKSSLVQWINVGISTDMQYGKYLMDDSLICWSTFKHRPKYLDLLLNKIHQLNLISLPTFWIFFQAFVYKYKIIIKQKYSCNMLLIFLLTSLRFTFINTNIQQFVRTFYNETGWYKYQTIVRHP